MRRLLIFLAAAAALITPVFAAPGTVSRPEPTPCTHSFEVSVAEEADCVHKGLLTYICSKCGLVYTAETLPTGEHDYILTENTATCTEDGEATYTCSVCGDTYTEPVIASGHVPASGPATCTRNRLCDLCGEIMERALGHDYSYQYDAEFDEAGELVSFGTWRCAKCGVTLQATESNALYYYSLSDTSEAADTDLDDVAAASSPTDADNDPAGQSEEEPEIVEPKEEPVAAEPEDPGAPNPRSGLWIGVCVAAIIALAAEAVFLTRSSGKKKVTR